MGVMDVLQLILAFIGSLCAGILFNVRKEKLFWAGLSGALGWITYSLLHTVTGAVIIPIFLGAVVVGLYSESAARILKTPVTVFSISGIFPLVPGITAYTAMQYLVENRLEEAAGKIVETLASAFAIAFGLMLITAIFRFSSRLREQKTNIKK